MTHITQLSHHSTHSFLLSKTLNIAQHLLCSWFGTIVQHLRIYTFLLLYSVTLPTPSKTILRQIMNNKLQMTRYKMPILHMTS